jgi:hypothetical protein
MRDELVQPKSAPDTAEASSQSSTVSIVS